MDRRFHFALTLPALVLLSAIAYCYSDSSSVAVITAHGWEWNSRAIARGSNLPQTAILTGPANSELVLKCTDQEVVSYYCKTPCQVHPCVQQSEDVQVNQRRPPNKTMLEAFFAVFTRAPEGNTSASDRGDADPNDAVVLQKGDELHLASALNRVSQGDYCFSLQALETAHANPVVFQLAWNKDHEPEGLVKLPALLPGAYVLDQKITRGSQTCVTDPHAVPAWILIAPDDQFVALTQKWEAYGPWFDQMTAAGDSLAVITTMQHAAIASLSRSLKH